MLTNDWFVCVRFVPWKKNCTHFIKLWSICCETCVYCRADYSSCSLHGLEKFKDVFCWSKYSRFVFKSVLCFSLQYFFLFYRFNDFFFFFEKMLYHLMVLVAPVILCFSSKSYYTFFWKPGWHRLLVISRGFLFIFNFLIYFFLSYSINIFISHHVCLSDVWHSSSLHDENLHFHICRPVLPS